MNPSNSGSPFGNSGAHWFGTFQMVDLVGIPVARCIQVFHSPFIFIHIPKTGGTGVEQALVRRVLAREGFQNLSREEATRFALPGGDRAEPPGGDGGRSSDAPRDSTLIPRFYRRGSSSERRPTFYPHGIPPKPSDPPQTMNPTSVSELNCHSKSATTTPHLP